MCLNPLIIEIYWKDLTPEKQEEILEFVGDNLNWDRILEKAEEFLEEEDE